MPPPSDPRSGSGDEGQIDTGFLPRAHWSNADTADTLCVFQEAAPTMPSRSYSRSSCRRNWRVYRL